MVEYASLMAVSLMAVSLMAVSLMAVLGVQTKEQ
jgi:hypothetical protein